MLTESLRATDLPWGRAAFNVRDGDRWVDYEAVDAAARGRGIAVRGGCFWIRASY